MIASRSVLPRPRPQSSGTGRPQLTSLVDMMVILLVFLLKSFSVEGQLITPSPDLQLPESAATAPVEPALSLEVTTGGIILDGRRVADLPGPAAVDSLVIAPLETALRGLASGATTPPITIQCDRRVDFAVLKRVLATCDRSGHGDLSLLVMREDG